MTYNVTTDYYNSYVFTVNSGSAVHAIENCLDSWLYDYDYTFKVENRWNDYQFTIAAKTIDWNEWIKDAIEDLIKQYDY